MQIGKGRRREEEREKKGNHRETSTKRPKTRKGEAETEAELEAEMEAEPKTESEADLEADSNGRRLEGKYSQPRHLELPAQSFAARERVRKQGRGRGRMNVQFLSEIIIIGLLDDQSNSVCRMLFVTRPVRLPSSFPVAE